MEVPGVDRTGSRLIATGGRLMTLPQPEYCTSASPAKSKAKDMVGKRFGRLLTISRFGSTSSRGATWSCICDCGNAPVVAGVSLRNGDIVSCGCYNRDRLIHRITHGQTRRHNRSRAYTCWASMLDRCTNPKTKCWPNYGGRGIKVCDEWFEFENFYADMGAPSDNLTLDRTNNDGNYEKGNCQWTDWGHQNRNKRIRVDNTTGRKGVSVHQGKYRATLKINGKYKHLGYFPLTSEGLEAASEKYQFVFDLYYGDSK